MKNIKFIIIAGYMLSSCMTQNKKTNIALRYLNDHPEFTARLCADRFKPNTIYKQGIPQHIPGPVILTEGDSIRCPDGTVMTSPVKEIQCPPSSRQVDTLEVENTARIAQLTIELAQKEQELIALNTKYAIAKRTLNKKTWTIYALGIIVTIGMLKCLKKGSYYFRKNG